MTSSYRYLPQHDLTYVRSMIGAAQTPVQRLAPMRSYLASPDYKHGQDFFFDMEHNVLPSTSAHMRIETIAELLNLFIRYSFSSKMVFYAPSENNFQHAQTFNRLIHRHVTQPTLVVRDETSAFLFLNRPGLTVSNLRASFDQQQHREDACATTYCR